MAKEDKQRRTDAQTAIVVPTIGSGGTVIGTAPNFTTPKIILGSAALIGTLDSVIRADATIVAFDTVAPTNINLAAAAVGTIAFAARRDHIHALDLTIAPTWTGQHSFTNATAPIISAKAGPSSTQQHIIPIIASDTFALLTATQTLANKTLTTPTIGDFTNAQHGHQNAAGGGVLNAAAITAGLLALARGGTNADLSATGGAGQYLKQVSAGAAITVGAVPDADLPSTIVRTSRLISAGVGLTGGGDLSADRTLAVGTPSTLNVATTNSVSGTTHAHAITSSSNPGAAAAILASDAGGKITLQALDAAGEIRNSGAANATPFTQTRLTVYRDVSNWGYLAYGSDAIMRVVFSSTAGANPLSFGTSTATDNTGTYTEKASLTAGGNFSTVGGLNIGAGSGATAGQIRASAAIRATLADNNTIEGFSGAAGSHTSIAVGRTTLEARLSIAAAANHFFTGSAAGDGAIRVDDSTKKLHIGVGSGTAAIVATSNAVTVNGDLTVTGNIIGSSTTSVVRLPVGTSVPTGGSSGDMKIATEIGTPLTDYIYININSTWRRVAIQ